MIFPLVCGFVGTYALYRSMCAPHFLYSRALIWVSLGLVSYFRSECQFLCQQHRIIADLQFLAAVLLAGGLVLYLIYCDLRTPDTVAPQRFEIEAVDDTPAIVALSFSWTCLFGSMLLGVWVMTLL